MICLPHRSPSGLLLRTARGRRPAVHQQTDAPWSITLAGAVLSFFLNGTYAGLYSYTPEVYPTWIRASGTGLASAFGRVGSILGFGGVFGLTTAVLSVGVICVLVFGLSTAGRSLEELTERVEVSK